MNKPQPMSPRARLQTLLSVPERERTEAQWDELNELEIMLAHENRRRVPEQGIRQNGTPPGHSKPGGGPGAKKQARKFHRRPPRGKGRDPAG